MLDRICTIALIGAIIIGVSVKVAHAQGCQGKAPRTGQDEYFMDAHGERVMFRGITSSGNVVEIWQDEEDGSWTATISFPNGFLCQVSDGLESEMGPFPIPEGYPEGVERPGDPT